MDSFYSDAAIKKISIAHQLEQSDPLNSANKTLIGKIIHEILSQKEIETNTDKIIQHYFNEGWIEKEDIVAIQDKIQNIINHPEIIPFLSESPLSLNEREILLENGEVIRPDKIIIKGGKVSIVDFKTGVPNPKHQIQLNKYEAAMRQLGYSEVEKYLIYTEALRVELVQ